MKNYLFIADHHGIHIVNKTVDNNMLIFRLSMVNRLELGHNAQTPFFITVNNRDLSTSTTNL